MGLVAGTENLRPQPLPMGTEVFRYFNNQYGHTNIHLTNIISIKIYFKGFPGGAVVGNPPANAGDMGSSPGPGGSLML